jgi:hypothetical protein
MKRNFIYFTRPQQINYVKTLNTKFKIHTIYDYIKHLKNMLNDFITLELLIRNI